MYTLNVMCTYNVFTSQFHMVRQRNLKGKETSLVKYYAIDFAEPDILTCKEETNEVEFSGLLAFQIRDPSLFLLRSIALSISENFPPRSGLSTNEWSGLAT